MRQSPSKAQLRGPDQDHFVRRHRTAPSGESKGRYNAILTTLMSLDAYSIALRNRPWMLYSPVYRIHRRWSFRYPRITKIYLQTLIVAKWTILSCTKKTHHSFKSIDRLIVTEHALNLHAKSLLSSRLYKTLHDPCPSTATEYRCMSVRCL